MTGDNDQLSRAASGDGDAMRALLERFGEPVWREINREIGPQFRSMIDADDVMQVTYMEAFLQMDRLAAQDEAAFVAWLRRIAKNNLTDAIKELTRKKRPAPGRRVKAGTGAWGESCVSLIYQLGSEGGTPSRQVARREAAEVVTALLERLPADYAKVIRLYDLEGQEIAEVAAALGRSPGATHMLRVRAHDRLRAMIGAETQFFTHVT